MHKQSVVHIYQAKEGPSHILRSRGDNTHEVITHKSNRQKNLTDDVFFQFLIMSAKMVSDL